MDNSFRIHIERKELNPYSRSFYDADVECRACGRPIKNRDTCSVVVHRGRDASGLDVFLPIPQEELPNDPVEWGSFVGPHCAKKLPKTHKVTYKRLFKNHSDTWC